MENIPSQWVLLIGIALLLMLGLRLWPRLQRQARAREAAALSQAEASRDAQK